jgi:DNA-binding MarR family transcriptional regulator
MNDAAFDALVALNAAYGTLARTVDAELGSLHGISQNELLLLRALAAARNGTLRPSELARAISLTPSGVSRAVTPLEQRGMVERTSDPNDRRACTIALTDDGAALLGVSLVSAAEIASRLMRRLSVGQSRQLERLLGEIA